MLGRPIAGTSVRLTPVAPADRDESSGASHEDDSADSIGHGGGDDDTASATDCEDDESEEASSEDQTSEEDASKDDESEEASIEEQPAKKKKKESANQTEPHHVHHIPPPLHACIHSPPPTSFISVASPYLHAGTAKERHLRITSLQGGQEPRGSRHAQEAAHHPGGPRAVAEAGGSLGRDPEPDHPRPHQA